jgi:hypothetical protein
VSARLLDRSCLVFPFAGKLRSALGLLFRLSLLVPAVAFAAMARS